MFWWCVPFIGETKKNRRISNFIRRAVCIFFPHGKYFLDLKVKEAESLVETASFFISS
jgi:hypothetical protein